MSYSFNWQQLLESPHSSDHIAQTYQDEAFLLEALGTYVRAGIRRGDGVVLFMRKNRWAALAAQFEVSGVDLQAAIERGQVASYDADEVLAGLIKDGALDRNAFRQMVASVFLGMRRSYPVIRAFGEMVDVLWHDDRRAAAVALENLWRELSRAEPFALLCGFQVDTLDRVSYSGAFEGVCKLHTHLIPARDYGRLDRAVSQASREVLDPPTAMMLESLAAKHRPRTEMPMGQAIIHWLSFNMPRTADRILARARAIYSGVS